MDHLKILKRALHITWNYRALWLIGLLLVLAGGGVFQSGFSPGSTSGAGRDSGTEPEWEGWRVHPRDLPDLWERIAPAVAVGVTIIVFILLLLLAIAVIAAIVRYVTQTSLIQMVHRYEETEEQIGFKGGWRLGWSRSAFRLFLINLVLKLPVALLMVVLIAPLVVFAVMSFTAETGPAIALGILLILLIIPVIMLGVAISIVLTPLREVVYRACVIEELGLKEAIVAGFALVRRNLGSTALQWLLLVGLGIGWRIVLIPVNLLLLFLALLVSGLPALLLGGMATLVASWPAGLVLGLLTFVPIFVIIVALPNVALTTLVTVYYSTSWTLTYRELCALDTDSQQVEWTDADQEDEEEAEEEEQEEEES